MNASKIHSGNVKQFATRLKEIFDKANNAPKLIIIRGCNLGNYTKRDGRGDGYKSLVQTIADITKVQVLSSGGYASGSFALQHPDFPTTLSAKYSDGTTLWDTFTGPIHFRPNGLTLEEAKDAVHDSLDDTYYVTDPD